jgi:hypothetical protein
VSRKKGEGEEAREVGTLGLESLELLGIASGRCPAGCGKYIAEDRGRRQAGSC